MEYDAITLDTNVFDQNRLNLDGGMLQLLAQFKEAPQFILSEIVVREIHRHLSEQAKTAKDALGSAIRKSDESGLLDAAAVASLNAIRSATAKPKEAARQRLERFLQNSGCEIIPADQADMKRLIRMYFGPSPPFEEGAKKKNEFPDAIALTTLEDWAKKKGKMILAISSDGGWARFAQTSEWIDVEMNLAVALEKFQADAERARTIVGRVLAEMQDGTRADLWEHVEGEVAPQVGDLSPEADGSAGYWFETDLAEFTFASLSFVRHDDDLAQLESRLFM
jgi:hypothetical protein